MHQQQGPLAAGGTGMTMGCKVNHSATSAGAKLPRRAHQPGSSRAAAPRMSARTHRRKQRMAQNKAAAEPVRADEEMVCADQQQDETMADDAADSWNTQREETIQPLMSQAQGSALTELVHAAAVSALSCDSEQQRQQQAAEVLQSFGYISAQPLQPLAEDGVKQPSQEQEVTQESQVTGSCMGGASDRRLTRDHINLTGQRELAIRAVSHHHHHLMFAPL